MCYCYGLGLWSALWVFLLMYQDKGGGPRLVSPHLKTQKTNPLSPHEDPCPSRVTGHVWSCSVSLQYGIFLLNIDANISDTLKLCDQMQPSSKLGGCQVPWSFPFMCMTYKCDSVKFHFDLCKENYMVFISYLFRWISICFVIISLG